MPSIVPGYEYDIFISYRHKDNKGDQWVTAFVAALHAELESTFKEDVSIYFDINPHDGLLENHDVDKTLSGKLNCVIFIPIISQTYCDPKCFAWQHELSGFNALSKQSALGTHVRLKNGNVASRILPIRIHDLDAHDTKMLTDELNGPLRSIDFIYREAGVNRPLRLKEEQSNKNQNQASYKNQINKVANAIKDIIESIARPGMPAIAKTQKEKLQPARQWNRNLSLALVAMVVILAFGYFLYSRFFKVDVQPEAFEKSIAVLPFVDMTPTGDMEYLGDGIAEEIINSLTSIRTLKVVGRTSSFQFKGEKLDLREVGAKLHVGIVLEGSVKKFKDHFRITAQLVRTADNFEIWSERYDLEETNIFKMQDNIAANVAEKLQLTLSTLEKRNIVKKEIDPEAYTLYLKGLYQYKAQKFAECIEFEEKVVELDSTYAPAFALLGLSKSWMIKRTNNWADVGAVNEAIGFSERAIALDPELAEGYSSIALIAWSLQYNFPKARQYFEKSVELNPAASLIKNRYGYFLVWMGDFDKASQLATEAMALDPVDYNSYAILSYASIYAGRFNDADKYLNEWQRIFGSTRPNISMSVRLNFAKGLFSKVVQQCDSLQTSGEPLNADELSFLARAYLKSDRKADGQKVLGNLKSMIAFSGSNAAFGAALVYASLNQQDSCFKYLELSRLHHDDSFTTLKINPALVKYKDDPRYIKIYDDAGFDKY